jgi:hypothetical protein
VGHILLPTTVSKFRNLFSAHADSGVIVAAIAEQLLGVGHFATFPCAFRTSRPAIADASSRLISPESQFFRMILIVPSQGIIDAVGVGNSNFSLRFFNAFLLLLPPSIPVVFGV